MYGRDFRAVAERLLKGHRFTPSQNDYDWLGQGIYFWEYGFDRALQFALDQKRRGKVKKPAVVGAAMMSQWRRTAQVESKQSPPRPSTRADLSQDPKPRSPRGHPVVTLSAERPTLAFAHSWSS